MPDEVKKKSFFSDLPDEEGEKKEEPKVEEKPKEEPAKEKSSMEVSLEKKSAALSEERRKRKELEAKLKEFEAKKEEKPKTAKDEEEDEETEPDKPGVVDRDSLIKELEERRHKEEYDTRVAESISVIAKGAAKPRQWAEKVQETVQSLPPNLRSGDPATDTATAIRFLESSSGSGSFVMPSSSVDLPISMTPGTEELSANGRELARQKLGLKDEEIDKYLKTPRIRLENGNTSFKLIK